MVRKWLFGSVDEVLSKTGCRHPNFDFLSGPAPGVKFVSQLAHLDCLRVWQRQNPCTLTGDNSMPRQALGLRLNQWRSTFHLLRPVRRHAIIQSRYNLLNKFLCVLRSNCTASFYETSRCRILPLDFVISLVALLSIPILDVNSINNNALLKVHLQNAGNFLGRFVRDQNSDKIKGSINARGHSPRRDHTETT